MVADIHELAARAKANLAEVDRAANDISWQVQHIEVAESFPTAGSIVQRVRAGITQNEVRGSLGIDTGFTFLEKTIRAWQPGHLNVIGGYTSHGKSAFACDAIVRAVTHTPDAVIVVFSLEMNAETYLVRLASNLTGIPSLSILQGKHISATKERIEAAFDEIATWKLIVFDDLYQWEKIAAKAQTIQGYVGLDLLIIEFIQNIAGKGGIYERMSLLAPQIQALAKKLNCTILALSQVSNEAINEDLRSINYKGAGEIAAAADLGLWLERDRKEEDLLHVAIRKNRHGPTGKARLRFTDHFTRLVEETGGNGISYVEEAEV